MAPSGLLNSFLAAIQASLSVLLVISYGAIAARFELLNSSTGKVISKICVRMFLPALLFVNIGSQLHASSADRYGIILLWAVFCHIISFIVGWLGVVTFKLPEWSLVAILFNNTTSYPLLLIEALDETGILSSLVSQDETSRQAIARAKSYFLVFATFSSCLTFAIGPRLIDSEHAPEPEADKTDDLQDEEVDYQPSSANERTALLPGGHRRVSIAQVSLWPPPQEYETSEEINEQYYDRRPSVLSKRRWLKLSPRTKWWLLFLFDFLNAPLLGAVAGAIVGLVPVLQRAFFNDTSNGGIFTAWLTASFKTVASLFVPLPVLIAGVSLYTNYIHNKELARIGQAAKTPWLPTIWVLIIRFVIWPVLSIAIVYGLARKSILGNDPMLYFAMMLMPTGPSAMKLITMVQVSDAGEEEEHKIAKLLTISYIISPILAFTVVGSLKASQAAIGV